jgi:endonuclease YncB( thermonuclease family)
MIDESITRDASADPRRNWAQTQERMREAIHAELDKINPTDDARRALELIIESSLRPSEVDGALKLTVIDQDGKPRVIDKDGQKREFTLQDLLEELRGRYGVLFRSAKPDAARAQTEQRPEKREKPQRDWLKLGGEAPKPEAEAPPSEAPPSSAEPAPLQNPGTGKPRIYEWSRNTLSRFKNPLAPKPGSQAEPGNQAAPVAAEHEQTVFGGMRTRSWLRPGLALGAVAILALLGVGALLFRDGDPVAPQASIARPAETNDVASTPLQDPEPSTTGSTTGSASLRGVPDVIDTATLSLKGEVVRLFGVEWAPGGGKPEDLTRYLNGREVACESVGSNDVYRCQVGNQDLSRVVLFNGGGRATNDATPDLKAAADKAREAKIGVWSKQP